MKCPVPECGSEMRLTRHPDYLTPFYTCEPCGLRMPEPYRGRLAIAPLPKPEPWRPRTKEELMDQWDDDESNDPAWDIQARTEDIARMLEEEAESVGGERNAPPFGYGAGCLRRMAKRIRELE